MGKILVLTGVTGKSGGAFLEIAGSRLHLVKERFPDGIRAIVRPTSRTEDLERLIPGVELVRGSLSDPGTLHKALKGADTLLHIAGIHWSRRIVRAAAENHVRRLILVHTTGIYSKYKAAGEGYRKTDELAYSICRENGIILTILRPTMIYGRISDKNVAIFIKMVDRFPIMPVVEGARYALQPVHYGDLGDAYFKVLMNEEATGNRDFILSGGAPILLREMLDEIGECLGKKTRYLSVPFRLAYSGAWLLYLLSFRKKDYREKVQRLCEPRTFPYREAAEAFGYAPRGFREGIKDEVLEYQESHRIRASLRRRTGRGR